MRIALIGGSGLVGSKLVEEMIKVNSIIEIILITRKKLKYSSEKISEIVLEEFNSQSILNLEVEADFFISTLGTTIRKAESKERFHEVDYSYVLSFAKIAEKLNARFINVSALGASPGSLFFYYKVKGELERDLKKLNLKSLDILKPSLLIGERKEARFGEGCAVTLYHLFSPILPRKIMKVFGERVEDLVSSIITCLKKNIKE